MTYTDYDETHEQKLLKILSVAPLVRSPAVWCKLGHNTFDLSPIRGGERGERRGRRGDEEEE